MDSWWRKLVLMFVILVWSLVIFNLVFFLCLLFGIFWVSWCWNLVNFLRFFLSGLGVLNFWLLFNVVKVEIFKLILIELLVLGNVLVDVFIIKFRKYLLVEFLIIVIDVGLIGKGFD